MAKQAGFEHVATITGVSGVTVDYNTGDVIIQGGGAGSSGYSGWSGYSGAAGGGSGVSGLSGYSGYSGLDGASGISGYSGYSGANGLPGVGVSGTSGYSGYSGATGTSGYSGINAVPFVGEIKLWFGTVATIPAGYHLCDGGIYNLVKTPDLRDKFIVCARQDDSGTAKTNITGSLTQTGGSISYTPAGTIDAHVTANRPDGTAVPSARLVSPGTHAFTGTQANIIPPYYALCYICYTG